MVLLRLRHPSGDIEPFEVQETLTITQVKEAAFAAWPKGESRRALCVAAARALVPASPLSWIHPARTQRARCPKKTPRLRPTCGSCAPASSWRTARRSRVRRCAFMRARAMPPGGHSAARPLRARLAAKSGRQRWCTCVAQQRAPCCRARPSVAKLQRRSGTAAAQRHSRQGRRHASCRAHALRVQHFAMCWEAASPACGGGGGSRRPALVQLRAALWCMYCVVSDVRHTPPASPYRVPRTIPNVTTDKAYYLCARRVPKGDGGAGGGNRGDDARAGAASAGGQSR